MSESDRKIERNRPLHYVVVRFLRVEISVLRDAIDDEGAVGCAEGVSLRVTWLLEYHRRAVGMSGDRTEGEERKQEEVEREQHRTRWGVWLGERWEEGENERF